MQILVNTGHNIDGNEKLSHYIEAEMEVALSRFSDQITRIEIHLSDENGGKAGSGDKRCLIEARPAGHQPVTVSHDAATVEDALDGASKKLRHLLVATLGRLHDRKGGATIEAHEDR